MSEERLKLVYDVTCTPEYSIKRHVIARLRLGQPQPESMISDLDFDNMVSRQRVKVERTLAPLRVWVDLEFGASTARIYAGGPLIPEMTIEVIEP